MENQKLRPVYMVYPGLFPLLMFNYWINKARVPAVGIVLSGFDTKHKGKILSFFEELVYFMKRTGWRYSIYMLLVAKFGVQLILIWNKLRRLLKKKIKLKSFQEISQENGIPIFCTDDFNGRETINFLKNVNANLIVSAYNNQILKSGVINFPKYKTINIHPGYLPDFRGLDAVFEALYHGVDKAGPTIHYVDRSIDTGEIILQEKLRIHKNDTLFSLNVKLWMHGAKMLSRVLDMIEDGKVTYHKQNLDKVKYPYRSYPVKQRIDEFIKKGGRIIKFKDLVNTLK